MRFIPNPKDSPPAEDPLKTKMALHRGKPQWQAEVPLAPRGFARAGPH